MSKPSVLQCISLACEKTCNDDKPLLDVDANERSITHQLAVHLGSYFPDYDIDCEYNRVGIEPKKLDGLKRSVSSDDTNATTVYPDIIVHKRRESDNLVVIEAKKQNISSELDRQKLKLYKSELGYKYAYMITFSTGTLAKMSKRFTVEEIK